MNSGWHHRRRGYGLAAALAGATLIAFAGCDLQRDVDSDRGQQLFVENCGSCHALVDAGTSSQVGPDLDAAFVAARDSGMGSKTIEGVVKAQIANPRPTSPEDVEVYMPADIVTGADATDVAAYVASVAGVEGLEAPEFLPADFFATNCGACHVLGVAGTTGTVGPDLDEVLPGQDPDQIAQSITDPEAETTPGFQPGVMPSFEAALTPEQLQQLVTYLRESLAGG